MASVGRGHKPLQPEPPPSRFTERSTECRIMDTELPSHGLANAVVALKKRGGSFVAERLDGIHPARAHCRQPDRYECHADQHGGNRRKHHRIPRLHLE